MSFTMQGEVKAAAAMLRAIIDKAEPHTLLTAEEWLEQADPNGTTPALVLRTDPRPIADLALALCRVMCGEQRLEAWQGKYRNVPLRGVQGGWQR